LRDGFEPVDLGHEPPLSVDGGTAGYVDRRRVSAQWFSGTILTGLCGAALMGGAVFASLDGETNFATMPERVEVALRGAVGGAGDKQAAVRKSDRLPPAGENTATRQIIRVSTMNRVGQREVVRVRPFIRVSANLALTSSEFAASIPPFNAQKLLAESEPEETPTAVAASAPGAEPDAEVSFVSRDLAPLLPRIKLAGTLPEIEVIAKLRETANWTGSTAPRYSIAGIPSVDPKKLAYAAEGDNDPYAGFESRIVPENVTLLPKTASQTTGGNSWNERVVAAKKNDSITAILRELGATPAEASALAAALGARGRDGALKEGLKVRALLSPIGSRTLPVRIIIANDNAIEAVVALSDTGKYVSVDVSSINSVSSVPEEEEDDGTGMRLYQSIYETALRNEMPRQVVENLIRIYSYDVDFQRRVQPGDSFDVIYAGEDETGGDGRTDVLLATLTVGGETKRFYRYQTLDDGIVDYYDETGKSAKKFLVRKPVGEGILRSGFGMRRHPILGYSKMHTGVDWAAPHGTPIYAAGNGAIDRVGWESGYGKYIRIRHANGYETAYGHMTAFARGIEEGVRVRQGQVIGYVGSTGLSTGAHLHYEVLVNSRFVDPIRIRLPRGRVLDGPMLASFEQERDRLDGMMARGGQHLAASTAR
jgi:murein DD-endopeptidase MepM/ murein hydrolase activator NlpD